MIMKKLFSILVLCLAFCFATFADNDKIIVFEQLPKTAQEFVKTYYPKQQVINIQQDIEDGDYELRLENGVKIDFNKLGSWTEIEGRVALPKGIISSNIYNYVAKNYKKSKIYKVERNQNGFEIELSNDLDLHFDLNGNFVRIDY